MRKIYSTDIFDKITISKTEKHVDNRTFWLMKNLKEVQLL